jgi:tetratricopeptide (TPR) repeat protein
LIGAHTTPCGCARSPREVALFEGASGSCRRGLHYGIMRNALIWVLLCCAPLFGCGNAEEKRSHPAPAAAKDSNNPGTVQSPNYAGLIEEYQTLLAEDPNNLAGIIALGNAYFDSGQWKKSIILYDHAIRIDPENADVRTDRGTAYQNTGMPDRALAEYRAALACEPSHLNARYNMGVVYAYTKKDYKAAIRIWEELLRLSPNYPKAENIRTAIAVFKKGLEKGTK